jgi:hypothetical protein
MIIDEEDVFAFESNELKIWEIVETEFVVLLVE